MKLHGYFRSSAAYRVRIALGLKGLKAEQVFHHLRKGEQRSEAHLKLNPQGLLPTLELDDGSVLTQSMAILEWLEETCPEPPLLAGNSVHRAEIRAFCYAIACDIHPVQNLKVLKKLRELGHSEDAVSAWAAWIIADGLDACEQLLARSTGPFCFGQAPLMADVCLVPQLANARRFGVDVSPFPKLLRAEAGCMALPAFAEAAPARQPDFEP